LLLAGEDDALSLLYFQDGPHPLEPAADWLRDASAFTEAVEQLQEYFAGKRQRFSLQLAPEGTPFQLRVWQELRNIPYGETISYGELARRIGKPNASRAVGTANGRNPLSIVVPCHRVIGANGTLTGFGGGLENKRTLLALERSYVSGLGF
jgi:methylated-DNA-[protein]-cysteine S-methyltransferase